MSNTSNPFQENKNNVMHAQGGEKKVMKKILSVALSTAMAFSMFASVAFGETATLTPQDKFESLKVKGIFTGDIDGLAHLDRDMTRAEFAKVITKVMGLKEVSGVYSYNDTGYNNAKNWAAPYIEAVTLAGVMQGQDLTKKLFNQKANVTVQELAEVLVKAMKIEIPTVIDNTATEWAKGSVQAAINAGLLSKDLNFQANASRSLLVEAAFAAEAALNVPPVLTATKVEKVSANNLKEVVVAFDGEVNADSATTVASYSIKDEDGNIVPLKSATISADNKNVTLTVGVSGLVEQNFRNQEKYQLTVNNVKGKDITKAISTSNFEFTPVDAALPTVVSVEGLGNKAIKVTFSEPVEATSSVADIFKLDDSVLSGVVTGSGTRTLIIELFTPLANTEHTLAINNKIQDFADYNLIATSEKFNVVEDKLAPTVTEVKNVTLETATVVFSEEVKAAPAIKASNYYWMNGTTKHYANSVTQIDGKTYKVTFTGTDKLPAVATDLYVTNIVDYSENIILADTKVSVNPVIDQTRPEIVSEVFNDTDTLKLTFNKAVDLTTFKTSNVVLKKGDGTVVTKGVTVAEGITGSSKTVTLVFSSALDAGIYTVEVSGLKDITTLQNQMLTSTSTITAKDGLSADVISVTGSGNVYYVTFDKAMDVTTTASILNPENYYLSYTQNSATKVGKLPSGTNIVPVNGNKGVIITLPSSVTAVSEITIQGVKSAGGVHLAGYAEKFGTAIAAPNNIVSTFSVVRAYATAKDTVVVKFNQPVSRLADISGITVNNNQVTNAVVDSNDSTLVTLTTTSINANAGVPINIPVAAFSNLASSPSIVYVNTVLDAIAPDAMKDSNGNVTGVTETNKVVTITLQEDVISKNDTKLKDNFKAYQANGLELEYGKDFTVTVANDTFAVDFTGTLYTGQVKIVFINSNDNIVDASAVNADGTTNTSLKASGFETTSALALNAGPVAPTGISATNETAAGANDGTLTGTAAGQEYQVAGGAWTSITGTSVTGLAPGSYNVRVKATATTQAGVATAIVIAAGPLAAGPVAPTGIAATNETAAGENDGTLTGTAAGQEYQVGGAGAWTAITGNTVTDLAPGSYTVRVKATATTQAGAATAPIVITAGL